MSLEDLVHLPKWIVATVFAMVSLSVIVPFAFAFLDPERSVSVWQVQIGARVNPAVQECRIAADAMIKALGSDDAEIAALTHLEEQHVAAVNQLRTKFLDQGIRDTTNIFPQQGYSSYQEDELESLNKITGDRKQVEAHKAQIAAQLVVVERKCGLADGGQNALAFHS